MIKRAIRQHGVAPSILDAVRNEDGHSEAYKLYPIGSPETPKKLRSQMFKICIWASLMMMGIKAIAAGDDASAWRSIQSEFNILSAQVEEYHERHRAKNNLRRTIEKAKVTAQVVVGSATMTLIRASGKSQPERLMAGVIAQAQAATKNGVDAAKLPNVLARMSEIGQPVMSSANGTESGPARRTRPADDDDERPPVGSCAFHAGGRHRTDKCDLLKGMNPAEKAQKIRERMEWLSKTQAGAKADTDAKAASSKRHK